MSIRFRTLCILMVTLACLVGIVGWIAHNLTLRSYADLEDQMVRQRAYRVSLALKDDTDYLLKSARDWAIWNDAYRFVAGQNPGFIRDNLNTQALDALSVDAIAFLDTRKHLVYAFTRRAKYTRLGQLPPAMRAAFQPGSAVLNRLTAHGECSGILVLQGETLRVATHPILQTDGKGPSHGTLVMFSTLNGNALTKLANTTQLSVSSETWDNPDIPTDFQTARQKLGQGMPITTIPRSEEMLAGYIRITDLLGQPALILRVTCARTIYQWGQAHLWRQMLLIAGTGLVIIVLALLLLDHLVLARLVRLHARVCAIEKNGDHTARIEEASHDELGQLARAVNGMLAALQQAEQDGLAREQAFRKTAIDTLPFPVVILTPEYDLIYANASLRKLLPRFAGHSLADLPLLDPITQTPIPVEQRPFQRLLRGEPFLTAEFILALDTARVPVLIHAGRVEVDGRLTAIVIAGQDITALKNADHAKDEFLAVLSHELLTPLTSILGWTELATQKPDIAVQTKALEVVLRNAHRQQRLLDDLLDMSRLMHAKLSYQPEALDLGLVAEQCVEHLEPTARRRQLTLVCECEGALPITADPLRLRQAIGNLLDNALKFTDAGGVITVSARSDGDRALFTVHDTGRGIARDALADLFNPFHQVERDEAAGGLGLGLALVKGIIELHGGRVTADSPGVGLGSTFTLALPLRVFEETHPERDAVSV